MERAKKIFSKIYDQYVEKIYRFIFLIVNSKEIAEDLTSETFLKGWKNFKKNQIENPKAFLYKIAKNLIIDFYRKKEKLKTVSAEAKPIADKNINLEEKILLNSDLKVVMNALSKLREEYKDAIILYYLDGLPISEIAQILDKSENATRVLISRAMKNLREEYEKGSKTCCNKI